MKKRKPTKTERSAKIASDYRIARMIARALKITNGTIVWMDPIEYYLPNAGDGFSAFVDGQRVDNIGDFIRKQKNLAKILRLVADVLDGKLHGGYYDEVLRFSYWSAFKKRDAIAVAQNASMLVLNPSCAEVYKELKNLLKPVHKMRPTEPIPTEHAVRRRLKILYPGFLKIRHKS